MDSALSDNPGYEIVMNTFDKQSAPITTIAYPHTDDAIRFVIDECSLGLILVAQSKRGVCAILFGDEPDALARNPRQRFPHATLVDDDADHERLVAQVVSFVDAPEVGLDLPLDVRGTAFQQRVWQELRRIAAGRTASYSEIAQRIGQPGAARAVARACASNMLAVAIPCHRSSAQRWRPVRLPLGGRTQARPACARVHQVSARDHASMPCDSNRRLAPRDA